MAAIRSPGRAAGSLVGRFLELLGERVTRLEEASAPGDVHRRINDAEHLLLADLLSADEEQEILRSGAAAELLARSQRCFERYETILERSMAALLCGPAAEPIRAPENVTQNYLQRYRSLTQAEVALAAIEAGDRVLFIGSGSLPQSALEYARQTGCSVSCVDYLAEAIEVSARITGSCAEGGKLRLFQARGEDFSVRGYDVVLVGVLAQPKAAILASLDRQADGGCRILCRTTTGVREFVYARTRPVALERFGPAGFSRALGDQIISTQLLTASGTASGWER